MFLGLLISHNFHSQVNGTPVRSGEALWKWLIKQSTNCAQSKGALEFFQPLQQSPKINLRRTHRCANEVARTCKTQSSASVCQKHPHASSLLFLFRRSSQSTRCISVALIIDVVSSVKWAKERCALVQILIVRRAREMRPRAEAERASSGNSHSRHFLRFCVWRLKVPARPPPARAHQRVSRVAASTLRAQTRKSCYRGYRRCIVMCLVAFQSAAKCVSRRRKEHRRLEISAHQTRVSRSLATIKILPIKRVPRVCDFIRTAEANLNHCTIKKRNQFWVFLGFKFGTFNVLTNATNELDRKRNQNIFLVVFVRVKVF